MTDFENQFENERYDDLWINLPKCPESAIRDLWFRNLRGQVVVDLGSGTDTDRYEAFLRKFGVVEYLPVDTKIDPSQDILPVLMWMEPSTAYSFSLNGINEAMLSKDSPEGTIITKEIIRLLHPEGLVFGYGGGGILQALYEYPGMEGEFLHVDVMNDPTNGYYFIGRKNPA